VFVDVRCTPWLGEQDAKEFRDRQNTGHASEATAADGMVKAVAPFWRFGREPLTDKRREEASASSHWLDTVPGLS